MVHVRVLIFLENNFQFKLRKEYSFLNSTLEWAQKSYSWATQRHKLMSFVFLDSKRVSTLISNDVASLQVKENLK